MNKAKIRDYKIAASYLRLTSTSSSLSSPYVHDFSVFGCLLLTQNTDPHVADPHQGRRAEGGLLGGGWKVLFCAWNPDHSHNQARSIQALHRHVLSVCQHPNMVYRILAQDKVGELQKPFLECHMYHMYHSDLTNSSGFTMFLQPFSPSLPG